MRSGYRILYGLLLPVLLGVFLVPPAALCQIHLEMVPGPQKMEPIPGTCTMWHELWPNFCAEHHQAGYDDKNGDGEMSVCDEIWMDDGQVLHIDWVGPTYWLDCDTDGVADRAVEPEDPTAQGSPVCQNWIEVWPVHGQPFHVEEWVDNGDGVVSPCDQVVVGGIPCHIVDLAVNIIVTPGGVPNEDSSWGKVKSGYEE